jgi:hypothetical protein
MIQIGIDCQEVFCSLKIGWALAFRTFRPSPYFFVEVDEMAVLAVGLIPAVLMTFFLAGLFFGRCVSFTMTFSLVPNHHIGFRERTR